MCQKNKLEIEIVPKTSWFLNLRSKLSKEDWDKLRKDAYKKANYRCEICGGKGKKWPVECHEIWSYDIETHTQKLERLIALCPLCHQVKHIGLAQKKGKGRATIKHLAKVNNCSIEEAEAQIEKAYDEWDKRNECSWVLDLSLLDKLI